LWRELRVGAMNSLLWALIVGPIAAIWFSDWKLGAVMASALMINLVSAALCGVLIPLTLKRLAIDPALAGGVILTTFTDCIGFLVFLGLGTLVLL
jgi:magnesium transporter